MDDEDYRALKKEFFEISERVYRDYMRLLVILDTCRWYKKEKEGK